VVKEAEISIIESLFFEMMQDRETAIPKAYKDTFEWLFKPHPDADQPSSWSSFPAWIEADTREIYWITGKPGAGKSTLVKFLTAHKKLRDHLAVWSGSDDLVVASFYSWNAGTGLQKSHSGLIQSLLGQCLRQRPNLVPKVCPKRWAILEMLGVGAIDDLPAWQWDELARCLDTLGSGAGNGYRLALFIDGLDEFEGDHGELVEVIKRLSNWPGVKICVSSRPWNVFNDAFDRSPSLKVQDLTLNDIICYIDGHFARLPAFNELQPGYPAEAASLTKGIAARADGVFLWVSVVVRAVAQRLTDGDRLQDLHVTVDQLPRDVEALFDAIRRQIDSRHLRKSSQYFLLLLEGRPYGIVLSAVTFFLADEDESSPHHQEFCHSNKAKLSWMDSTMRRRLHSRTMGLVETSGSGAVTFLHRTVLEWVTRPENLTAIKRDASTGFNPNLELFKARTTEFSSALSPPYTSGRGELRSLRESETLLETSLIHAALASYRPEDKQRLVQTFDRLEGYTHHIIDPEQFQTYDDSRMFNIISDRSRKSLQLRIDLIHMAAKFAIAPLVMVKLDKAALRSSSSPLSYQDLLENVVFGRLRHDIDVPPKGFEKMLFFALKSVPWESRLPLLEMRLEILKHLFHIGPHNWAKRRALETIMAEIREKLRFSRVENWKKKYLVDVEALLQRELSLRGWITRYFVKKGEAGSGSGTEPSVRGRVGEREVTREEIRYWIGQV
jgi:hypothetical protein